MQKQNYLFLCNNEKAYPFFQMLYVGTVIFGPATALEVGKVIKCTLSLIKVKGHALSD